MNINQKDCNASLQVSAGYLGTLWQIFSICLSCLILALSFAYFPKMARIVRSSVISIKDLEYVESARAVGAGDSYIIFKYILRNAASPILVQATFNFALAILDEAALSFLGVGIMPPAPSLGGMITDARSFMTVAPWLIIAPGLMIIFSVLAFNLLGDGLRDFLDPHLRGKIN